MVYLYVYITDWRWNKHYIEAAEPSRNEPLSLLRLSWCTRAMRVCLQAVTSVWVLVCSANCKVKTPGEAKNCFFFFALRFNCLLASNIFYLMHTHPLLVYWLFVLIPMMMILWLSIIYFVTRVDIFFKEIAIFSNKKLSFILVIYLV